MVLHNYNVEERCNTSFLQNNQFNKASSQNPCQECMYASQCYHYFTESKECYEFRMANDIYSYPPKNELAMVYYSLQLFQFVMNWKLDSKV